MDAKMRELIDLNKWIDEREKSTIPCRKCGELIPDSEQTLCDDCLEDVYLDFTDRMDKLIDGYSVAQLEALLAKKMYEPLQFMIASRVDYLKRMRD